MGQVNAPTLGRSVSIDQAARLMNVSRRTIYNRIRTGHLQTIRTLGGSQRVLVETLACGARRAPSPPPGDPAYRGPQQVKPTPPPAPPPKRSIDAESHT